MEILVTGRHVEVKDRFRRHVQEKLAKVPQLAPRLQRLDVVVSHEGNGRQSSAAERIEITCIGKGPVVRAEAAAEDPYVALDKAYAKLLERLRRVHDRRVVSRRKHVVTPVGVAPADLADTVVENETLDRDDGLADSPVQIRHKEHTATAMTLDQALYEMELVGHDFYLFVDADCGKPSVVYRRRGWEYGVIQLAVADSTWSQDRVGSYSAVGVG